MWQKIKPYCLLLAWLLSGCALLNDSDRKKPLPSNLIATPASYYSTAKARYLGSKYKDHLDRLTERIVRNSTTAPLQFANNISSVGGIGFFTHSATKTPDERYLEVVLSTPETFETKGEYSLKVNQLFSRYGQELLAILAGDNEMFQDNALAGYGLNFTWRNVIADAPANRVSLARAIIYFPKERVQGFLRRNIGQNDLLGDAVIFAVEDDGPLNLVSYQPREIKQDFRPAIREDNLAAGAATAKPSVAPPPAAEPAKQSTQKPAVKADPVKKELPVVQAPNPAPMFKKPADGTESSEGAPLARQDVPSSARSVTSSNVATPKPSVAKQDSEPEKVASAQQPVESRSVKPVPEIAFPKPPTPISTESASTADKFDSGKPAVAPLETAIKTPPEKRVSDERTPPKNSAEAMKSVQLPSQQTENTKSPTVSMPVTKSVSAPSATPMEKATKNPVIVAAPSSAADGPRPPTRETKIAISAPLDEKLPAPAEVKAAEPVKAVEEKKVDVATKTAAWKSVAEPAPSIVAVAPTEAPSAPEKLSEKPAVIAQKPAAAPPSKISPAPLAPVPAPAEVRVVEPLKAVEEKKIDVATKTETGKAAAEPKPPVVAAQSADKPLQKPAAVVEKPPVPARAEVAPAPIVKVPAPAEVKVVEPVRAVDEKKVEEKKLEAKNRTKIGEPTVAKTDAPTGAVAAPEPVRLAEVQRPEPTVRPPIEKPAESPTPRKAESVVPVPTTKAEIRETKPASPAAPAMVPNQEKPAAAPEQLALARKPVEPLGESVPLIRPTPKSLHGFIIQVAFNDKQKAQSWAEKMTQRGYAVSVTEAGAEGSLRVRLGNFTVRDEAERQLQTFKQEGMSGIIINLPQAFRPEARSSLP